MADARFKPMPVSEQIQADKTMKAAIIEEFGGTKQLMYMDVPMLKCGPGEVLINVHAASVNPVDWKARQGFLQGMMPAFGGKPGTGIILGWDGAGVIEACGFGVYGFEVGEKVFFRPENFDWGCYAQYCLAGVHTIAKMPSNMTFEEAAAVPLAGITAYQALIVEGGLKAGEKVLIHAGSGGVGHLAVQIAAAVGAEVTATCSGKNSEFVKSLGATTTVDYRETDFATVVKDMDVVFNTVSKETADRSIPCLKDQGRLVSIAGSADAAAIAAKGASAKALFMIPNGEHLAAIGTMIEAGKVKVTVAKTFKLSEAATAQDYQEKGGFVGKVVMKVEHDDPMVN